MNSIGPYLGGIFFLTASFLNEKRYLSYKNGISRKDGIIINLNWGPKTFPVKFDYLYEKKSAFVTYKFLIENTWHEKTEEAWMLFTKGAKKEGDSIKIYIPKSKNPRKSTSFYRRYTIIIYFRFKSKSTSFSISVWYKDDND